MIVKKGLLLIVFTLLAVFTLQANPLSRSKKKKLQFKYRASFAPIISLYKNNADYTSSNSPRAGINLSLRLEPNWKGNFHVHLGFELNRYALDFDSYYFAQGYSVIYDRNFDFKHSLRYFDAQIPLLLKYSFPEEEENENTFYFIGGWSLRGIFFGRTTIQQISTGEILLNKKYSSPTIEYPLLVSQLGGVLQFGFGAQRNILHSHRSVFVELLWKYPVSRIHYNGYKNSNNLYIKDSHVLVSLGVKI